jgi:hypothetical protein
MTQGWMQETAWRPGMVVYQPAVPAIQEAKLGES